MKNMRNVFFAAFVLSCGVAVFAGSDVEQKIKDAQMQKTASVEKICAPQKIDFNFNNLIELAKKAREYAYCPYSKFKVGAAVLAKNGKIYTGCNVENASYGLCNCAERTAIFKAVSEGEKGNFIKAVAIVLDAPDFGAPCGACRQVVNEFADSSAIIIMATVNGNYKIECQGTLLPHAFKLDEVEPVK
jgi:cytidine deaminase